jgi:hypothetical protein
MSHFFPEHKTKGRFSSIDSLQNAWKIFVSEPLFFHWSCIAFSGSVALFCGKDMSQKNEVLFDKKQLLVFRFQNFRLHVSDFMLPVYETDFIG